MIKSLKQYIIPVHVHP